MMAAAAQKPQTGLPRHQTRAAGRPAARVRWPSFDGLCGHADVMDAQGFHCDQYQSQSLATLDEARPTF